MRDHTTESAPSVYLPSSSALSFNADLRIWRLRQQTKNGFIDECKNTTVSAKHHFASQSIEVVDKYATIRNGK